MLLLALGVVSIVAAAIREGTLEPGALPSVRDRRRSRIALDPHDPHAGHAMHPGLPSLVAFPYGFPRAGRYRVFVQVKRAGRVETGAFDVDVADGDGFQ